MDFSTWITNCIVIIGFIVTGWFQKKRIDSLRQNVSSLEKTIAAQENALSAMERAANIIDVEKYQKHMNTFENLVERNNALTLKKMEQELIEKFQKQDELKSKRSREVINLLLKYYFDMIKFSINALYYVHADERKALVNNLQFPVHREFLLEHLERIKDIWLYPSKYMAFFAFLEAKLPRKMDNIS